MSETDAAITRFDEASAIFREAVANARDLSAYVGLVADVIAKRGWADVEWGPMSDSDGYPTLHSLALGYAGVQVDLARWPSRDELYGAIQGAKDAFDALDAAWEALPEAVRHHVSRPSKTTIPEHLG